MIKCARLRTQRLLNFTQALQTSKLRKQQGFQVALTGPGAGLLTDATVTVVTRHKAAKKTPV
jgi:hypothetical protein